MNKTYTKCILGYTFWTSIVIINFENSFLADINSKWFLGFLYPFSSVSVQSLSRVQLFVTPSTAARQASLSITNSWSLLKLMSIESVMPSHHLILCCPLLLLSSIFPSIRVFSNELVLLIKWPKYIGLGVVKKSKTWAIKTKLGRYYEWRLLQWLGRQLLCSIIQLCFNSFLWALSNEFIFRTYLTSEVMITFCP